MTIQNVKAGKQWERNGWNVLEKSGIGGLVKA